MAPSRRLPPAVFADLLAALGPDRFAAFVTALYAARGWDVDRDGRSLTLYRGDGPDRRTVLTAAAGSEPPSVGDEGPDAVVASRRTRAVERLAEDAGAVVHGPEELYQLLLYGVDRETADELCRDYLGRSIEAEPGEESATVVGSSDGSDADGAIDPEPSDHGRTDAAGTTTAEARGPTRPSRRLLVGTVALLVLVVVGAAASGGFVDRPFTGPDSGADTGAIDPPATPSDPTPTDAGAPSATPDDRRSATAPTHAEARDGAGASERRYVQLTPTCERPPELVAVIIVGALRNNDPETDDGIRTAWYFSSHSSVGSTYPNFARFVTRERFEPLYAHRRVEYAQTYREDGIAAYDVTVIDETGQGHTYLMAFSNEADGSRRGSISNGQAGDGEACWRLAGILPE